MLIPHILDNAKPYVVYHHLVDDLIFYVGSGVLARAFDHGSARRNEAWNEFSRGKRVSVLIRRTFEDRSSARRFEYGDIHALRPIANLSFDPTMVFEFETREIAGHDQRVATDPWENMAVRVLPSKADYWDLPSASGATGVPRGLISQSVVLDVPVGPDKLLFRRIPRGLAKEARSLP